MSLRLLLDITHFYYFITIQHLLSRKLFKKILTHYNKASSHSLCSSSYLEPFCTPHSGNILYAKSGSKRANNNQVAVGISEGNMYVFTITIVSRLPCVGVW